MRDMMSYWDEYFSFCHDGKKPEHEIHALILELESNAKFATDHLFLATVWENVFNNWETVLSCLAKAEECAASTFEYMECSVHYTLHFGAAYNQKAVDLVRKGERVVGNYFDWLSCANGWFSLRGGGHEEQALRCFKRAMESALHEGEDVTRKLAMCAGYSDLWRKKELRVYKTKCLVLAEKNAECCTDWTACATTWKNSDRIKWLECLDKAKKAAVSLEDWIACMHAYDPESPEDENPGFHECLGKIRSLITCEDDWLKCCREHDPNIPRRKILNDFFEGLAGRQSNVVV